MTDYNNPIYQEALEIYSTEEWNKNSLHYFKLTERLVNTKLSFKYNSYQTYYKPSEDKLEMAEKYSGNNIREQYVNNIRALLN